MDKLIFYKMFKKFKEKNTIFVASEKEKKINKQNN